jgi:polysaccharide biosynthesis/export protein
MLSTFLRRFCLLVLSGLFLVSCVDTRQATYFNGVNDGTITTQTPVPESIIRPNDLLSITVTSLNATATEIFNTPNTAGSQPGQGVAGYLVNSDGSIQFPMLGSIKASGFTKEQLKESIRKSITDRQLLKDPIVNIRYLNFRVTVLGEVRNPTVLTIPNEKVSLLEAIGLAGDLTIYGKRENVLIVREENGQKLIKRINLNSSELLSSPYYYLKSDDVVYVEPNKAKVASARGGQWVPAALSALSLLVVVVDRLIAK